MELVGSAITAAFVGLIWALIKVVDYFISKNKIKTSQLDPLQLKEFVTFFNNFQNNCKEQNKMLKDILDHSKDIYDMHNVYNEDHVPAWYVSPDLIRIVRENNMKSIDLLKQLIEIGSDQDTIVNKMAELITSQKLMTERLGDLIFALNKKM